MLLNEILIYVKNVNNLYLLLLLLLLLYTYMTDLYTFLYYLNNKLC